MSVPARDPCADRDVVLIVGGGISAYKSVIVAREILRRGGRVETVLTSAATRFVGGVTFAGITGRPARTDLWDPTFSGELHIELTRMADAIVVAPATANLMGRAAHGLADDLATTVLLSARGAIVMAPAMHPRMWNHPATQVNVTTLRERGVLFAGPVDGPLASGESGMGRMAEPDAIVEALSTALGRGDLEGVRVLVTAGPTHEPIDPVRFVGNRSSGRMGVALAERARARGAVVTLIHGPMTATAPAGVEAIAVRTAAEMRAAVVACAATQDAVVMAAAVADYRPVVLAKEKIKKGPDEITLSMVRNADILAELGRTPGRSPARVLVGFALETVNLLASAREKLVRKGCDLVVANLAADGFEHDDNRVTLVEADDEQPLDKMSKRAVADAIWDRVRTIRAKKLEGRGVEERTPT